MSRQNESAKQRPKFVGNYLTYQSSGALNFRKQSFHLAPCVLRLLDFVSKSCGYCIERTCRPDVVSALAKLIIQLLKTRQGIVCRVEAKDEVSRPIFDIFQL
jgi:hypothetical protein